MYYPECTCASLAFYPKAFNYPLVWQVSWLSPGCLAFPFGFRNSGKRGKQPFLIEITVAGTAQVFHLIPF
jgi:hypothetical protein